jgi:glutathione S-transferase
MKPQGSGDGMTLFWSSRSPYARYVTVVANECGLIDRISLERVAVSPSRFHSEVSRHNPLGKIPTLVLADGRSIIDSKMICRFLDQNGATPGALVPTGDEHWEMTKLEAIGVGLADLGVGYVIEEFRMKGSPPSPQALAAQERVRYVLDSLEQLVPSLAAGPPHLGTFAVAVALKYLDFRTGAAGEWRQSRPSLGQWLDDGMARRESFLATEFENVV